MWKVKVTSNFSFAKLAKKLPKIIDNIFEDIGKDSAIISKSNIDNQTDFGGSFYKPLEESTIAKRRAGLYVRNERVRAQTGTTPLKYTEKLYKSIKGDKKGLYMEDYGWLHHKGEDTNTTDIEGEPITITRNVQPVRAFIEVGIGEKTEKKFYDNLIKGLKK